MIKSLKIIAFILIAPLIYLSQSCIDIGHADKRTEETEINELAETLSNLKNEGYDIDTTSSGMYYIIHEAGTGPTIQIGDTCYVKYAAYLLSGVLLETSSYYTDGIWAMIYKSEPLITGFDEALGMMNKGMQADFIIPSKLAYGSEGKTGIPPYSSLIFSIELKDLKPR